MNETIQVEGIIKEVLPNTMFRVEIDRANDLEQLIGRLILCHISGKMRKHFIKLFVGDRVRVDMSPKYDIDRGRIEYKLKN